MVMRDKKKYNAYMRDYMLSRYRARRDEAVTLLGGQCAQCGSGERLELDHTDPTSKTLAIGKLWSVSRTRYEAELTKCQLLCHACHTLKTIRDRGLKVAKGRHGSVSSYRYCHCENCGRAARDYSREYRRRKKHVEA